MEVHGVFFGNLTFFSRRIFFLRGWKIVVVLHAQWFLFVLLSVATFLRAFFSSHRKGKVACNTQ